MTRKHARELRKQIVALASTLPDETALTVAEFFPQWKTGTAYVVDDRIVYEDVLYKVVQAHTSQADWTPDKVPALYTVVSIDEWPEWKQPTGAQDAYKKGDKVKHNGAKWVSLIDANVWEPTASVPTLWEAVN